MGEMPHMVVILLTTITGPTPTTGPAELQPSTTSPDLLTQLTDALTAVAIVVGGVFAYFKFIKGRVLSAATLIEIKASMASQPTPRRPAPPKPGALLVELVIRNNAQGALTVPKDSYQLVSISSITEEELARTGQDLTQDALSWKCPDAYFAQTNMLLDDGNQPTDDITLGPGGAMTLAAVFAVPSGHNAAAFLVVVNSQTVSRRRLRRCVSWAEGRKLVVPGQESR
jgi:hypothetical protein